MTEVLTCWNDINEPEFCMYASSDHLHSWPFNYYALRHNLALSYTSDSIAPDKRLGLFDHVLLNSVSQLEILLD